MKKECPICKRVVDEDVVQICREAQGWILDTIRRAHPEWVQEDGSCSKCLDYYQKLRKCKP